MELKIENESVLNQIPLQSECSLNAGNTCQAGSDVSNVRGPSLPFVTSLRAEEGAENRRI